MDGCKGGGGLPGLVAVKLRCVQFPLWWKGWLVVAGSGVIMCVFSNLIFHSGDGFAFHEGLWGPSSGFQHVGWMHHWKVSTAQFGLCWALVL